MSLEFSDLPDDTRVKLTDEGRHELWHRVDEFGGVKKLSNAFDFSASKMYNWRNKNSFMPISFVKRLMGDNPSRIEAIKGNGRGKEWQTDFPIAENPELLTRIRQSVKVNEEGVPFYITGEKTLYSRFQELLDEIQVPYRSYSRKRYEIRYPKFVHEVFQQMSFEEDISALVDESGHIDNDSVIVGDRKIPVSDFKGTLYSRDKKLELAIARNDTDTIQQLISEESYKVRKLVGQ